MGKHPASGLQGVPAVHHDDLGFLVGVDQSVGKGHACCSRSDHQVVGLDHVQVAAPEGCEREARRFYGQVTFDLATSGIAIAVKTARPEVSVVGVVFEMQNPQLHV